MPNRFPLAAGLILASIVVTAGQRPVPIYDLAYVQKETAGYTSNADLFFRRVDGSGGRRIVTERSLDMAANAWAPGGGRLVYSAFRAADEAASDLCPGYSNRPLYVLDVARLEKADEIVTTRLTDLLVVPGFSWSPDGRHLAFASVCEDPKRAPKRESTISAVYVIDIQEGKARRVTEFGPFGMPSWSPDGKRLAVAGMKPGFAEMGVYVMNPDGTDMQRVVDGTLPLWSPKGNLIAYMRGTALLVVAPDGTGRKGIEVLSSGQTVEWTPDGASLLVASRFVLVVDVTTGAKIDLGYPAMDTRLGADGRSVLVSRSADITSIDFGVRPPVSKVIVNADKGHSLTFGLAVRPK